MKPGGKPRGMTYADVLARKRAIELGIQKAAADTALRVEADTRTQRAMWLDQMTREVVADYAYEKLRRRAQQVTGMDIAYLYGRGASAPGGGGKEERGTGGPVHAV